MTNNNLKQVFLFVFLFKLCMTDEIGFNASEENNELEHVVVHVQKCCASGQVLENSVCTNKSVLFQPHIFRANKTHYWSLLKPQIQIDVFNPCRFGRFPLEPEEVEEDSWFLFENGSLYLNYTCDMLHSSDFCMETLMPDEGTVRAFICITRQPSEFPPKVAMVTCELFSALCLLIFGVWFFKQRKNSADENKTKCLICFFFTMCIASILNAISVSVGNCSSFVWCKMLWFLRYYMTLVYFTYLSILVYVLYKHFKNQSLHKLFFVRFCPAVFAVLFTVALVAVLSWTIPMVPLEYYSPEVQSKLVDSLLFYLPTGLLVVPSTVATVAIYIMVKPKIRERLNWNQMLLSRDWRDLDLVDQREYRTYTILMVFVTIYWILNLIVFVMSGSNNEKIELLICTIFSRLLGVMCCLIFVNKKSFEVCTCKGSKSSSDDTAEEMELTIKK